MDGRRCGERIEQERAPRHGLVGLTARKAQQLLAQRHWLLRHTRAPRLVPEELAQPRAQRRLLAGAQRQLLECGEDAGDDPPLGKLAAFGGISRYPARVKCAVLAWHTLKAALEASDDPVTTE